MMKRLAEFVRVERVLVGGGRARGAEGESLECLEGLCERRAGGRLGEGLGR